MDDAIAKELDRILTQAAHASSGSAVVGVGTLASLRAAVVAGSGRDASGDEFHRKGQRASARKRSSRTFDHVNRAAESVARQNQTMADAHLAAAVQRILETAGVKRSLPTIRKHLKARL